MQVGSLVVCINFNFHEDVIPLQPDTIYTIKIITPAYSVSRQRAETGAYLEEIVNKLGVNGLEWCYGLEIFREIQPPMEIKLSELLPEKQPA